jgi:hypothetical protein
MTKFGYFVSKNPHRPNSPRFGTVAMTRPDKDDADQTHRVSFAFITQNRGDEPEVFKKSFGRNTAEDRLKNGDGVIEINMRGSIPDVMRAALDLAIKSKVEMPSWVRKAHKQKTLVYGLSEKAAQVALEAKTKPAPR